MIFTKDNLIKLYDLLKDLQSIHTEWEFEFEYEVLEGRPKYDCYWMIIKATNSEGSFVNFTDSDSKSLSDFLSGHNIDNIMEWFTTLMNRMSK
jgi:hypothetical protein